MKSINTKNISVEKYFYGKSTEVSADPAITAAEGGFAGLLAELRQCPPGYVETANIPSLIVHLITRTKWVREYFRESADFMLKTMAEHLSDEDNVSRWLLSKRKWYDGALSKMFPAEWARLSRVERYKFREKVRPLFLAEFKNRSAEHLNKLALGFTSMQGVLPEVFREAHNKALAKAPVSEVRAQKYEKHRFSVHETTSSLILGDTACVFEQQNSTDYRFCPFDDGSPAAVNVFLPISSHRILVGTTLRESAPNDAKRFNQIAASCSFEYFVSCDGQEMKSLTTLIGSKAEIIEQSEFDRLKDSFIESLYGDD